jgi:hypothetical protein
MKWLEHLATSPRRKIIVGVIIASFVSLIISAVLMQILESPVKLATSYGILDLEFAWNAATANIILTAWGTTYIPYEILGTYTDFVFIPSYATFMAGLTLLLTRRFSGQTQTLGFMLVIAPFVAGLLDVVENLHLLIMLGSPTTITDSIPLIASICASIKFALIIITIVYFFIGLIIQGIREARHR